MAPSAGRYSVFAHLTADKVVLYRAILGVFTKAKQRFALHLRPAEIETALLETGVTEDRAGIGAALAQLHEWNSVEAHPDTADVATVEDFYLPRHLYQLTPAGEAAEQALNLFDRVLNEGGQLQAVALTDIRVQLEELRDIMETDPLDEGKAHRSLLSLRSRFEELTAKAQAFMASLQRSIDLHGLAMPALISYKETLIEYLERFIGDLLLATAEISTLLRKLDSAGIDRVLLAISRRELVDVLSPSDADRAAAHQAWQARWDGLRSWFLRQSDQPSQAEVLRQRARSAIPALLAAVAGLNDRRVARSDRAADLRSLALWFATTENDQDAHRLWRAAFSLSPARHLSIDEDSLAERDLNPTPPQTSWLDAPPIGISPRLRESGRYSRPGPASRVIDRTAEKAALARLMEEEAAQIEAARRRLGTGAPVRLSQLGMLDPAEFDLMLDLIGQAVASRVRGSDIIEASSTDGSLSIVLEPPSDGKEAELKTTIGSLRSPDFLVTIRDAFGD